MKGRLEHRGRLARVLVGRAALVLLVLAMAACTTMREQPVVYYVLRDGAAPPAPPVRLGRSTLLVAPMEVERFYDTTAIAFSRAPGTRGYYRYAFWTDRPGQTLTRLLLARLETAGAFSGVALTTSGVDGDFILNTTLAEFYHDAATAPGVARVRVTAELVDRRTQRLVARKTFDHAAPAASYDAAGEVAGFRQAMGAILEALTLWVADTVR